jgi:DNA polymerase-3 subunit alpha (Gram-positive type)
MHDLISSSEYQELEKEYPFLARARGKRIEELDYVILDIETTGLEPSRDELTEIAALKIRGREISEIFSSLIRPAKPIPAEITALTGIDDEMVRDFPPAGGVLPGFLDFVQGSILVAHNAEFDIGFIKYHLKNLNERELSNQVICTVKLGRYLLPELENYKLHTLASRLGFKTENRHRAVGDAEITYQIWLKFMDLLKEKGITSKRELDSLLSRL